MNCSVIGKLTHRVSVDILDIEFCSMGDQQVDDFTVAVPGGPHQAGDLKPENNERKESREEMKIKDNKRGGTEEKTQNRRQATAAQEQRSSS